MRSFVAVVLALVVSSASALAPQPPVSTVDRRQAMATAFKIGASIAGVTALPHQASAIRSVTSVEVEDIYAYNQKAPVTKVR